MTGTLSAVGRSGIIQVGPGQSFTYVLTSTHEFIGTVQLRRSTDGTNWIAQVESIGTASVPLTGTIASGTIVNETGARAWYDVAVVVYDDTSDSVSYVVTPVALDSAAMAGTHAVLKTEAGTHIVLSAHPTLSRLCHVIVTVDETYLIGSGTLPTIAIGEDDTIAKGLADTVLTNQAAGVILSRAFTNLPGKRIIITSTAAVGNSTGGCTVSVIAIPVS